MATVYRARDLKHERTVAIKVLRPDLAEAIGADRFLREIRTTANLSHPHILPLHDSGEAEGFLFYVMPFVKGESLRDRLEREGQLPIEDAVQIAREVAGALAYAHDEGVIHRDIKPANILLERGHALLADFGIAQAKAGVQETRLTGSGMSLGTPSYMSPEQITGDKEVDGRSDQYALACLLYEMLAGHAPFEGADIQTVMRQHLAADPPSITQARATVPKGVAKAVHRALAKTPADRFRTMGEFEKALAGATLPLLARIPLGRARAVVFAGAIVLALVAVGVIASQWKPGGPELARDRVVVVPFSNRTDDAVLDGFARTVTAATAVCLDQSGIVDVVPPERTFGWWEGTLEGGAADPGLDLPGALAERFGAGIIVEGSILAGIDSIRLQTGFREARDFGGAQQLPLVGVPRENPGEGRGPERLCETLSAALARHLDEFWGVAGEETSRRFSTPSSLSAWEEWRACADAYVRGDLEESLRHCQNANRLDPTFSPAKVSEAVLYFNLGAYSAADSILKEVDESPYPLASGNQTQARWLRATLDGDREGAYLNTKNENHGDPMWVWVWSNEALRTNRPREALEALSILDPDLPWVQRGVGHWSSLADVLHALSDHGRELREARRGRELHPDNPDLLRAEIRAQAALGHAREVDVLLEEAVNRDVQPVEAFRVAALELRAHGEREASFAVGERALALLQGDAAELEPSWELLRTLYVAERWEEAEGIVEGLLGNNPSLPFEKYLRGYEGALAARTGDAETARDIADRLATMDFPYDRGKATYEQARIVALLGEQVRAVQLLRQAYEEGWAYSIDLHTEMDFETLRGFGPFEEFVKPRG